MKKKYSLAVLFTLVVCVLGIFAQDSLAQNTTKDKQPIQTCQREPYVMPSIISTNNTVFAEYLKFASLPKKSRFSAFAELAPQQKATVMRTRLAMLLVRHSDLTLAQMEYISDLISAISPEMYQNDDQLKRAIEQRFNTEIENKALALFPQKIAFEILEGIGTDQSENIVLIQKYENLILTERSTRKKLVAEMTLNDRLAIWKTQLAYHLITAALNKEHRTLLIEMLSEMKAIFSASTTLTGMERDAYANSLEGRMFKVFSKAEAFAIFMTVGIHYKHVLAQVETGGGLDSIQSRETKYFKNIS